MQIEESLKDLYKSDSVHKDLVLEFYRRGNSEPFLTLSHSGILEESMKIEESLTSSEDLDFGSCEATQFEVTLIDVSEDIKEAEVHVYQNISGLYPSESLYPAEDLYPNGYTMPLGRYIVQTAKKQKNSRFRDLVALDFMSLFDVSVIDWYNSLSFPLTVKAFRSSLCKHIGVTEHVPDYLPNDDVLVEKTIDTEELIGRDVLVACEQINGAFGHFDRNGVLQHIILEPNCVLVPSEDLYPSEDLFAGAVDETVDLTYSETIEPYLCISYEYEDYTVQPIDTVHIRQEEGDIGAIYGEGKNCYIVEGNFLLFGKNTAELEKIASGIYGMVSGRKYIPVELEMRGLPYLEVGALEYISADSLSTYLMKRTLTGISALRDVHMATGQEWRGVESNVNTEIIQLKGRSAVLKKTVEEVSATVTNLENQTVAQFKILSDQITSEVTRAKGTEAELSSKITQQADLIELKVSKGEISSQLSLESGQVYISGNRLVVDSTNFKLDSSGNVSVTGNITGSKISGSNISGSVFESDTFYADDEEVRFGDFYVSADESYCLSSNDGSIVFRTAEDPSGDSFASLTIGFEGNQVYLGYGAGHFDQTVYADSFYGEGTATSNLYDLRIRKSWWEGCTVTERIQFLSDCLWEMAIIIDDQWEEGSSRKGIYDALDEYFEENKPW